jgi:hypothetical protein
MMVVALWYAAFAVLTLQKNTIKNKRALFIE